MLTQSSSTNEPFQHLLPFVTYCGRHPGLCPLTDRSSVGAAFCYRCHSVAPGKLMFRD